MSNDRGGGPRYVGDAPIGSFWTVRHFVDAACYGIFGVAMFVVGGGWLILAGIAAIGYGLKIAVLGGPYWVSTAVYAVVFIAILVAFGSA